MDPDTQNPAQEAAIRDALRRVHDPEIGESIVDLGLVERITLAPRAVEVLLIPTSATCPMSEMLLEDAEAALRDALPAGTQVRVRLDWETPWCAQRMTPALRERFGW